jgi:hypothetical protein
VPRKIFGLKGEEIRGDCKNLQNEFYDFHFFARCFLGDQIRRMRWLENVVFRTEQKCLQTFGVKT